MHCKPISFHICGVELKENSQRKFIALRTLSLIPNDFQIENFDVNWPKILEFDPLKCALSLICELTSGAEKENPEASNIKAVVQ